MRKRKEHVLLGRRRPGVLHESEMAEGLKIWGEGSNKSLFD